MPEQTPALDPLSTSQTRSWICPFGAPFVASVVGGEGRIFQSCCNHWECPCCGEVRARQEYARIVNGCEVLAVKHRLYFWTLTCRGKEISLAEAEEKYYAWTNVLLTNARTKAKRHGDFWAYVQVTERQKKTRKHPHSHIITTFLPEDARETAQGKDRRGYVSAWFTEANLRAGLGNQHRISQVVSAAAVSRYVAKYMFKETMNETFPPKWKRVRYSQNFPKLPERHDDVIIVLRSPSDWRRADLTSVTWVIENEIIYQMAAHRIARVVHGKPA